MCGRFTLTVPGEQAAPQFGLGPAGATLAPRYNIAPTQPVAAVRASESGRELALLRWGLIPPWAKDLSIGARMINARAETAAEKPAFRGAMKQRRCLILADGFYEWQTTGSGKQPFYFRVEGGRPFAFAGLWEQWRNHQGDQIHSCTILTTEANELVRPLHDRMPVILRLDDYERWLDPSLRDAAAVADLLAPYSPDAMETYPVSKAVNRVSNEGVELIAPLA